MALFFNGRLLVTPQVASRIDDSKMFNRNSAVGNVLAVIGKADAGQPKTALRFGTPNEAATALRGGELVDLITRSFAPSNDLPSGPSTVVAIRVDPATQASLTLNNISATPVITLASQNYGALANRTQVSISSGSTRGKKLRTKLDTTIYETDNVGRRYLSVQYSGAAASADATVTGTSMVLSAPSGSVNSTISFTDAPTVNDLVERINLVSGWTASVLDGSGAMPTAASIDFTTAAPAKAAPLEVTGDLQAIVDWFNSTAEALVVATKSSNAGTLPANISGAYLSGAQTGTSLTSDWQDALTALQAVDVQWIAAASGDPAIHAMISAHCTLASTVLRKERRAILGTPLNTSDTAAMALAKAINNDRVGLVHIGAYDYNTAGNLTLYAPYVAAAMVAGGFAGINPGQAMTAKALNVRGLERQLRDPTDTDQLLLAGVMPLLDEPTGYRVVQSISTWLTNGNYNKRELSVGAALDYVARTIREALAPLKGMSNGPARIADAKVRAETALRELSVPEPQGIGALVGTAQNPAWRNLRIAVNADVLAVEFECSPVIPVNYIPVTIFAVPYSGTS